ncbi:MAG: hypothetical protein AABW90_03560 [Nanoarchaeota archaeon]
MKKLFGYLSALAGLIGLFLNSTAGRKLFPFIKNFPKEYLLIPSLVLIVFGIFILIIFGKDGKAKQIEKEVPIYKGKKIIGYRIEG